LSNRTTPTDEELAAFIDGELGAARTAEVAAMVEADPALALRIQGYRSDMDLIAAVYGPLIERPLPNAWVDRIERASDVRRLDRRMPRGVARGFAALAATLILLLGGWLVYRTAAPTGEPIVAEALAARNGAMRPEFDVVDQMLTPAARSQILTANLAMTLKAPDLSRMGFRLAALRIYDHVAGGKAAELSYRDAAGREFTLYLRRPSSPPKVDLTERGGVRICIWQDDVVGAVMVGRMSAGEMARISSLAYAGLNL
jgi:anti-sigma factor RsiW